MYGYKHFKANNIKNTSIAEKNPPDYPFYLRGLGAMVYDPIVGVVRACGGEYTKKHSEKTTTDQCFQYDGIEWKTMPPIQGNNI